MSLRAVAFLLAVATVIQAITPEIIQVRGKRQNCRCVRDVNVQGALTCGCASPVLIPGVPLAAAQYQQQLALASQLQYVQPVYTRQVSGIQGEWADFSCGCVPLMFLANPVYSCQCNNVQTTPPSVGTTSPGVTEQTTTTTGLPEVVPTTTTPLPTPPLVITSTTTTTTTTTPPPQPPTITTPTTTTTTTTTPVPTTTSTLPTTTTAATIPVTTTPPCIYPPLATINGTTPGCFCLDVSTQVVRPFCGCQCDCNNGLTSVPTGVCSCPQVTQTVAPVPTGAQSDGQDSMYPLTTTCVIKIGASQPSSTCSCLPQYNNCAPNICCLKPGFRSLKKAAATAPDDRSAIDLIIDMLKTMRKNL